MIKKYRKKYDKLRCHFPIILVLLLADKNKKLTIKTQSK